jgi:outer membrane biosynthesis protein TonB
MVSLLTSSTTIADVVVIPDTPNVGDTTTITTVTTGNLVTTNNLISQDFNDGSWVGTMFPDNSDINESTWLTGKHDTYAETTINSEDYVSIQEMQQGFTSNFDAQVRWWNPTESEFTMTQTISNGIDTTTQSTTFQDTTNHNYQLNPYGNTLIVAPDPNMTHGTLTLRFDFNILGNQNYNGGHAGVDVTDPTLIIDYTALSSTQSTTVEYCWQKNPPTCPGQDEIAEVENIIDNFQDTLDDFIIEDLYVYEEDPFIPEVLTIEYSFNPEVFKEEEFEIQDDYLAFDDFFFEEQFIEPEYYEEVVLEEFIPEDIVMVETLDWNDSNVEIFDEMPVIEEVYEAIPEEMFVEEFTEEMQDEFIEEVEEIYEEVVMEEAQPVEEVAMAKEPEVIEEMPNEIEEQPSSEDIVADEPEPTTETVQQEETIEEPVETEPTIVAEKPESKTEADVEVNIDVKVAAIEKAIQGKIKNEMQRVSVTLNVINELVSKEMTASQPDMTSYFNINAALFDTRQLPSGNQDFFIQTDLQGYDKTIYLAQANIAGTDPVVQYQIKVNEAKTKTDNALRKLKELLNARNIQ